MRLTRSQILEGLSHPNRFVRDKVLDYFEGSSDHGVDVTHRIIGAVERFGWRDAFPHTSRICEFELDEKSLDWVLDQIEQGEFEDHPRHVSTRHFLCRMVGGAPVELLAKRREGIGRLTCFAEPFRYRQEDAPLKVIDRRIEYVRLSPEAAWRKIEEVCEEAIDQDEFARAQINEAEVLLELIIAQQSVSIAPRVLATLNALQPRSRSAAE